MSVSFSESPGRPRRWGGRHRSARTVLFALVAALVLGVGVASAALAGFSPFADQRVGQTYARGILLPTNQWVSPLGKRILDNQERLVSSSISPNGQYLAALGWNEFQGYLDIFNLQTGTQVSHMALETDPKGADDTNVGTDGPLWSPDGSTLYVPQVSYVLRYAVDANGAATQTASIATCGSPITSDKCAGYSADPTQNSTSTAWLPAGMALSPDGLSLYVALNGDNAIGVINTVTNTLVREIPVGNAPRQVVLANNGTVAYVSNEGGAVAQPGQFTNLSDGTPMVASKVTGAAITGTVSKVNLLTGQVSSTIPVGLQPTALYQSGNALFVANSNDDSISVIDESTDKVVQTLHTNPVPGATVGSYANAITLVGNKLLVSIGRDNAIAVYRYTSLNTPIRFQGLLPTDFYPVQVQADQALGGQIVVTNDKGIGARGPATKLNKGPDTNIATAQNTYDDTGTLTLFSLPNAAGITQATRTVIRNNAWNIIKPVNRGTYDSVPSVIPRKLGGKSPIKHILVIVKENRTYDQVLGDLGQGNGDPTLAQFGQAVTPNFHALARRFGNLDNFYDEGTLSADGHNWLVQAEANDYVEKEFGAFYRSYPSQAGDALAYQRDGFLWDAAKKAHKSVQNFGEYMYLPYSLPTGTPPWTQWYLESQWLENGHQGPEPIPNPCQYVRTSVDVPSLQAITERCFPNFQLGVPDQYRVDEWQPTFARQKASGKLPALSFMWLMSDHTGGGKNSPYPVAQVADNDLAVGRVIDQVSHSRFWKSTAIFVVEDDTQNGVDHVDGHRGPVFVVSPYSKPGVDDRYYTQVNLVRTIEQILGIRPMNQDDLSAEPMYAAFRAKPNLAPFNVQSETVPLTLGAPGYPSTFFRKATRSRAAIREGYVPADMRAVVTAWTAWSDHQAALGHFAHEDRVNPAQLDRFDWYSAHNWSVAYPGDARILLPNEVPGRRLPAAFMGN